ncbi:glycosyltransferase [Hyphomicrobium sp.]|uniref:glycosyltransferase n=1 Tax=Hyphomicrobium sp. TaxID=82 RepID=UPI002E358760|nr:glycosyltransferase [Hyphomicrobium sp.]HEX2842497.1 glycosyltransferase [Hyphomicrobium sp.]
MSETSVGIVVIGRNEGARLERCLASVADLGLPCVYVDSGSTDGSIAAARRAGALVVELDLTIPFTAARARNAGFAALKSAHPGVAFVQFVDGDCELAAGWIEAARTFLVAHPDVAIVCGRRRERFPEQSLYNRMCDIEWNTPIGEAQACGGDCLARTEAFAAVGGFRATLIAGEEPDLCRRLRNAGWRIWRLDHEMTLHDAAILTFGQWWRRSVRAGHAFAEVSSLHPERDFPWHRNVKSALAWSSLMGASLIAALWDWRAAVVVLLFPVQIFRIAQRQRVNGKPDYGYGSLILAGKVAETVGILKFYVNRLLSKENTLIEYK